MNAAGDIATRARSSRRCPFRIGVTNPHSPHRLATVVDVDGAIATSGTHERGRHLIDPRTGKHGTRADSAKVTGPDLGTADALATALAVAGREFFEVIETREAYEGFIIEKDGSWDFIAGFPFSRDSEPFVRRS